MSDLEASENDKYVALTFLRNAEVAAKGVLPFCQDTGTAIIHGEKGQQVWTGYCDEEALSLGVYKTYTEENLRYSQNAPLTMYDEVNNKCNLPAQIDLEATEGMEYKFLCVTKGGGSANKTYLYQETKAILNPGTLVPFLVEKMKTLGTAACPPYHIAFVIGGTSAEKNLLTVKLASTHYYDSLPTTGNEFGRAFRDIELEKQVLEEAHRIGLGAQFGIAEEGECYVFIVFAGFGIAQNLSYLLVVRTAKHKRYIAEGGVRQSGKTFLFDFQDGFPFELAYRYIIFREQIILGRVFAEQEHGLILKRCDSHSYMLFSMFCLTMGRPNEV